MARSDSGALHSNVNTLLLIAMRLLCALVRTARKTCPAWEIDSGLPIPGVLHHLNWCRAKFTGAHLYIGGVQTVSGANFAEVVGLGLAAFRNDQDSVVTGPPAQFAFELLLLVSISVQF